jgi:ribosomal protein S18 acetylase RimI-like enzyme
MEDMVEFRTRDAQTHDGPRPRLRRATATDAAAVARIWADGWRDGHLGHVPEALVAVRTPASFRDRAAERVSDTVVADVGGFVAGFVMVVGDEVEQVYVSGEHRGSGVATTLLTEAERIVAASGHRRAWLAVVAGNERARRFYERCGWVDEGPFDYTAAGPDGSIAVPARRYVKALAGRPQL